ncbi:hypothetical protein DITRI_Ditri01bG0100700 [Diplodiscus trichospermus]
MNCTQSNELLIKWNGSTAGSILPSRGIRQGEPLSPYLFVLCIEKLNHMIMDCIDAGEWKPIKVARNGPSLSHLFFAYDIVLFAVASLDQIKVIKQCLDGICSWSGQRVSFERSKIFFSANVDPYLAAQISDCANIPIATDMGRYLGIPSLHGRVSLNTFQYIINKVKKKLGG